MNQRVARDPFGLAADAPLLRAYLEALDRRAAGEHSFFTPGHKGSTAFTGVVAGDTSLAGGVDTIKFKHGWLAAAEQRAATLFGADVCRFSVGGSTHCNQALALAVGAPRDTIVVSRTAHRSVLLGLVLAGLRPAWVQPEVDPATGLSAGFAPERVAEALAANPDAAAVFLGDPSYVGSFSDLREHARVAHEAGVPLLVDAAWAAYFGFHPDLPDHAIRAGADAMVTSAHKTLPAYSQGALLLARTGRIGGARLERAFEATHTTSPAGAIMASIDGVRALLEHHGERLLGRVLKDVSEARARLREVQGLHVLEGPGVDPAKLAIALAGTGAHGVEVESDLIDAGVPVEMADRDTIVAVVTVADDSASLRRLTDALSPSIERRRSTPRKVAKVAGWIVEPQVAVPPREAFFGDTQTVPIARAVGRISAELIAPYPPGVPVLAPGERVTTDALAALTEARDSGLRVAYATDPRLATLEVLTTSS
ncbi:MAG: decarboxylase [Actinomycetota bacterium]|nr:decarboxylase [Actinomycetota bacterium]